LNVQNIVYFGLASYHNWGQISCYR